MNARFGTVVLTGATSGIGEATALRLAAMARTLIILGVESEEGAAAVIERIRRAGAPALLTRLLIPSLAERARIVNVGSSAHRIEHFEFGNIDLDHGYSPIAAYARAKLAMVTWSSLLAEEEAGTSTTVVALCPGLNDTPLSAAMTGGTGGPPSHGAARVLFAASADVPSGSYLEDDRVVTPSREALDAGNREQLTRLYWERLAPFAATAGAGR